MISHHFIQLFLKQSFDELKNILNEDVILQEGCIRTQFRYEHFLTAQVMSDYKLCISYSVLSKNQMQLREFFYKKNAFFYTHHCAHPKSWSASLLSDSIYNLKTLKGRELAKQWLIGTITKMLSDIKKWLDDYDDAMLEFP